MGRVTCRIMVGATHQTKYNAGPLIAAISPAEINHRFIRLSSVRQSSDRVPQTGQIETLTGPEDWPR